MKTGALHDWDLTPKQVLEAFAHLRLVPDLLLYDGRGPLPVDWTNRKSEEDHLGHTCPSAHS